MKSEILRRIEISQRLLAQAIEFGLWQSACREAQEIAKLCADLAQLEKEGQ